MDATFIQEQIDTIKLQINAYNAALTALAAGIQEYMIDTGQTRQKVTKLDLKDLNAVLDSLYNRLAVLEQRLNGSGNSIARPAW